MNQKTILALVAIIVTVGIVITASTIATPSASALKVIVREKDTRSNPNSAEIRSNQEIDKRGGGDSGGL
jgi:hypothetical protein